MRNYLSFHAHMTRLFTRISVVILTSLLPFELYTGFHEEGRGLLTGGLPLALSIDSMGKFWRTYVTVWLVSFLTFWEMKKFKDQIIVPFHDDSQVRIFFLNCPPSRCVYNPSALSCL